MDVTNTINVLDVLQRNFYKTKLIKRDCRKCRLGV